MASFWWCSLRPSSACRHKDTGYKHTGKGVEKDTGYKHTGKDTGALILWLALSLITQVRYNLTISATPSAYCVTHVVLYSCFNTCIAINRQISKNDHKFCQELPPKYFLRSLSKDYCIVIVLVMLNNSYISLCAPDTRRAGPRYSPWRRLGRCGAAVGRAGLPARCHGNRARPAPAPRSYWLRCVDVTLGARFSSLPLRCAAACGRFPGQPPGRPGAILVRPEGGAPQEEGGAGVPCGAVLLFCVF